jgi:adenine phosphoribosyltransferase
MLYNGCIKKFNITRKKYNTEGILMEDAKVLLIDDVLATGGTLIAANKLVLSAGFEVCGAITLLEISALNGRALLEQHGIANHSVLAS